MREENLRHWQKKILATAWITYASFYLLRVNMSVAIPGIIKEFGFSKTEVGSILSALFFVYAAGQFINGQFGDNFSAKKLVAIGLFGSTLLNFIFGYTNGILLVMILIWGLNGFFQSMGWAPTVKIVASWFPTHKRGKAAGILGSSYQIGNAASWLLAGFVVGHFGWHFVFWVPTVFTLLILIFWVNELKEKAEEGGFETVEITRKVNGFRDTISSTVKNKKIWTVALGLFGLNIVRYGFLDWAPTYFFEVQKAAISSAAYKAIIFPMAGSIGALSAGWISDTVFKGRRAPMAVVMLILLGLAALYFPHIPKQDWILSLVFLAIIGFLTFGPHMLMVTALPMDLGTKEMAASAAGFIDGWGYIGATLTGVGTGFLLDHFGWNTAFYFWVSGAFLAAVLMATLWNHRRENEV
ncbi:MFS transporter [Candidatus Gottesmanbacteria bacterium]|nr:MFS transporter [Candidatus Gottesmanbacteria bacterium]